MCIGVKSPQEKPAGTAAPRLQKTWGRGTGCAVLRTHPHLAGCWPWEQCAQGFTDSERITLAKSGSGGGQSKVNTVVAAGAPGLGEQPQEPPRELLDQHQACNKHQQHPTSVHKVTHEEMGAQGGRGTAPACRPPGPAPVPGTHPLPQQQCLQHGDAHST